MQDVRSSMLGLPHLCRKKRERQQFCWVEMPLSLWQYNVSLRQQRWRGHNHKKRVDDNCLSADLPTKPDQIHPESRPLIEASNGHKRPSDLPVFFAIALPRCDPRTHTFCIFLSCLPPTLSSPPRFPAHFPSRDCHLPFPPVDWIFSRCHKHGGCYPPGFCHLSKTRCHFHSPSHPSPLCLLILASLLLSLMGQSCVFASACAGASCVIPILCSQNRFSLRFGASWKHFCQHQPSIFLSPLPSLPPLFFI